MARARLSKRTVDALERPASGQTFLWDTEIRGLGVRAGPTGTKSFVIQYENSEGRTRRVKIGRFGVLTVEQAREIARIKLGEVLSGKDPAEEVRKARNAISVSELCDWYLAEAEAGRLLGRRRRPVASSTLALDRSRIEKHVKPLLGKRAVRGLSVADLERFQADVAAGKTARDRKGRGGQTTGGAGVAGRTLGMLHTMFEQSARWGLIEANPARSARKIEGDTKQDRRLSDADIGALGGAMRHGDESPVALAAIRLMLLTGFRRMEVLSLQHSWVDKDSGCIRFPSTKTGPQVQPVGDVALRIITGQPRVGNSAFVFPGEMGNDHFVGITRVLGRLSAVANLIPVTPHVLRHTYASVAADMGYSELTISALLGYASRGVTQRYVHLDKAVQSAANDVAAHFERLLDTLQARS